MHARNAKSLRVLGYRGAAKTIRVGEKCWFCLCDPARAGANLLKGKLVTMSLSSKWHEAVPGSVCGQTFLLMLVCFSLDPALSSPQPFLCAGLSSGLASTTTVIIMCRLIDRRVLYASPSFKFVGRACGQQLCFTGSAHLSTDINSDLKSLSSCNEMTQFFHMGRCLPHAG